MVTMSAGRTYSLPLSTSTALVTNLLKTPSGTLNLMIDGNRGVASAEDWAHVDHVSNVLTL